MPETRTAQVDPRQPRFGQFLTGLTALIAFVFQLPVLMIALAVIAGLGQLSPRTNLWRYAYLGFKKVAGLGPPRELEDAAPPRFAMTLAFVFFTLAGVLYFALGFQTAAWVIDVMIIGLGFLGAAGFCVGCEIYLFARRLQARRALAA
ncbi:MAG: DUF4395 domain-containing protein [Actinobacteria bacterium]|nr:DUF4395 domain-containing protein [Actinomycetota bacterium]